MSTEFVDSGAAAPAAPRPRRRIGGRVIVLFAVFAGLAGGGLWLWASSGSTTDQLIDEDAVRQAVEQRDEPLPDTAAAEDRDAEFREAIQGRWWRDDYYGRAFLDLHEGGEGLMVIQFNTGYSFLLGERVDVDVEWKVENGRAIFDSVRGRPESTFRTVTKEKGTRRDRKIAEITDEHMLLVDDLEDGDVSRWVRLK